MTGQHGRNVRVEVWMRDLSPPPDDPRRSVLARLQELDEAGFVDDVSVRVWGESVVVSDDWIEERAPPVRERVAEFHEWAERTGHSLEPAFRRCERSTMFSEERHEVIQLPLQCLAVYVGDRLIEVFPSSTGGETRTVENCLHRLETGIDDANVE